MGLYERWTAIDETKINVHAMGAALSEVARGSLAKAQLVSAFGLDSTDESELDLIIAEYNSLGTAVDKVRFIGKLEDVMILSETGHYTKSKAKTELGF
jgi:hypothetical protein